MTSTEETAASPPPPAAAPPAPRRRRWPRRVAFGLLALAILAFLSPFALSLVPVRRYVAQRVSKVLGREVTIGGLTARWWSGIELRDVRVANPAGFAGEPLLVVERVHADVAVLPMLGGKVDADVRVERPVVTLLQGPDGTWNSQGLLPDREEKPAGSSPSVHVAVVGGRVVSRGTREDTTGTLDEIEADVRLLPDGGRMAFVRGRALGAGAGGADALVQVRAEVDGAGVGRVQALVPRLNLARVSGLAAAALQADAVSGAVAVDADLTLDPRGGDGSAKVDLDQISVWAGGGVVAIRSGALALTPSSRGDDLRVDVALELRDVRASGFSAAGEDWVEPRVEVRGALVRTKAGDLAFGEAGAPLSLSAKALSGTVSGSWPADPRAKADLSADLRLVLSPTIGRMLGILRDPSDGLAGTVSLAAKAAGAGDAVDLRLDVEAKDVVIGGGGGGGAGDRAPWRAPRAVLTVVGTRTAEGITLTTAKAEAGGLAANAEGPITVRDGRVAGRVVATADLGRMAGLRALVSALEDVRGGAVRIEAVAPGVDRVDWKATATNLAFGPGALSSQGHVERETLAEGTLDVARGRPRTLTITRFQSALVSLVPGKGDLPVVLSEGGVAVDGRATAALDLAVASAAFDRALGLAPGERITGRLEAALEAKASSDDLSLDASISGSDVRPPASWRAGEGGRVQGRARVRRTGAQTTIELDDLSLFGVEADGSATLAAGTGLQKAHLEAKADLASARPFLSFLPPGSRMEGRATATVDAAPEGPATALRARVAVERLRWTRADGSVVDEPTVVVESDARLGTAPGRHEVRSLKVTTSAVQLAAVGNASTSAAGTAFALRANVLGDGRALAERLRGMLGESYADLTGEGRLTGTVTVGGAPGGLRAMTVDADLALPRLSSGGLTADQARLTAKRPDAASPLAVTANANVNQGTLVASATCDLARDGNPWNGRAEVRSVDTSTLVVGKGVGRFLPMVLPAIVPAGASTPVLSGRLDADLELAAYAPGQMELLDALRGTGRLDMGQGNVQDSSLFSGLASGARAGAMGKLLTLVPSVGGRFDALGKSLLFSELASRFEIGSRVVTLLEVRLASESVSLRFSGKVGFDGTMDLSIPVQLRGDLGQSVGRYLKDGIVPVRVTGQVGALRVLPNVKLKDVAPDVVEGLLEKAGGLFGK